MKIFVLGINHKSAHLDVREKFAVDLQDIPDFLGQASALPYVEELCLLSTCNRVEIYAVSQHPLLVKEPLIDFLAQYQKVDKKYLKDGTYFYSDEQAIEHGFAVAASLDSMVLGESQILGQMKTAYQIALSNGHTGKILNKFFHQAFFVAKKIRSETEIGHYPVSISYAAVVLAKQIFGDLHSKKALIIGAGKMSKLAIKHFNNSKVGKLYITNRTESRAIDLAEKLQGEVIPFKNFKQWLSDADIILTSTNSPHYLIELNDIQEAIKKRKNQAMFLIDLAVPRDIAPEINHVSNVFLYDIDDLGDVVAANRQERSREAKAAFKILQQETTAFKNTLKQFELVPTLSSLSKKFENICEFELQKTLQKLPDLNAEEKAAIAHMAQSIVKKVLHDPMVTLKEESQEAVDYQLLVRKLFRLDEM